MKQRLISAALTGAAMCALGLAVWAAVGRNPEEAPRPEAQAAPQAACPMRVAGAKVNVVEIESGVVIHVTAEDAGAVKSIKAAASGAQAAGPMAGCGHCGRGNEGGPKEHAH
jgi:hypothetical protein